MFDIYDITDMNGVVVTETKFFDDSAVEVNEIEVVELYLYISQATK